MMIEGLLSRLRRDGVHIWLEDGRLRYRAPKGVLTPERIAEIRASQHEIGAFLADAQSLASELTPIDGNRPLGALPLSFAQERLWFLEQLGLAGGSYNIATTIRMQGTLDADALQRAFAELVRRHESLRTRIATVDGRPVQVIDPPNDRALGVVDLSDSAPDMQTAAAQRLARDNTAQPFDLAGAPPLRASLVRLAPDHHLLLLAMHHIVSDAWSIELLIRDIAALYGAFRAGHPSPLTPLPVQYADYALWQRRWLSGPTLQRQLGYWTERLSGAPEALNLPFDRPRRATPSFAGAIHWFSIPDDVASELRGLGQREGATLFMVLLAAFQLLLSRLCDQDDVVIGSPVAGRRRHELQDLIGFFANILVLRSDCSANPSFRDLLQRVKTTALDAYAHQDLPFEKLVETLQPERDLARHPLIQVMFAVQRSPFDALTLPDLTLTPIAGEVGTTKFDLTLQVYESASGLEASFEYATELFDPSTIEHLAGCLLQLLKGIVADPDRPIAQLPLLDEAEQRRLLIDRNTTATAYPGDRCLHELFHEQAVRTPEVIAVEDGTRRVSYGALEAWSDGIAAQLHAVGVRAGATVGLSGERSADLIAAMLGILKAGAIYVPLDPGYPSERLAFMADDAGLDAVVVAPGGAAVAGLPAVRTEGPHGAPHAPSTAHGGAAVAYIMYTSGSTGVPKGIAVPHRAIARLVLGTDYICIAPGDRLAQLASPSFDAATFELWGALLNGASLVIIDRDTLLSSQSFATALREKRITSAFVTTALFNRLVRDVPDVFAPVRDLLFGGEAADPDAVRTVLAADPPQRLIHVYGPTEATTFSTWLHVREVAADARTVPIGGPLANSTCHVLDRWLQPVPTGAAGELYLGGDGLAHGYWGRPALTAERFIPDPFGAPGSRLYRSGDRVRRLPDASIEYLTRLDGQVKIRGYRIELGEIEAALRTHAAVEQVAVVARDSAGGKRLVAYVVGKHSIPLAAAELQRHLKQHLPDYMVPAAFVGIDTLPLTPNGKLDRNALPAPSTDAASAQQVTPRTAVEKMLSALWCEVLQGALPGIDDNFFDCGGHSLIAAQLMARIADAFSVELPLRTLFEAPTIRALALRVEEARRQGAGFAIPPLTRRPRPSPLPLSYAQEPLWFLDQVGMVGAAYNMAGALRLDGCLDATALALSFGDVVRRHENLRTRFALVEGRGAQVIDEAASGEEPAFRLDVVDLSILPAEQRDTETRRLAAEHTRNPFDLRSGPLLRAKLLRLGERAHLLLVNMHHIIADGWSVGVLLKELGNRYAAHVAGDPSPLAELPVQYADYAIWQREWLAGDILARYLDYWTSHLAGAPAALELPTDRPRPPAQTFAGATLPFSLPGDLSVRLAEFARREGATLYMVLLAGLSVLLCRHAGQEDIVIGSPVAGRSRRELEELTGMFVNMLVMRNDLTGNPTFRELLKRVRETTLGAYAHRDLPFETLVDVLQPERDLSRQPLFQVCLAFENIGFDGLTLPGLSVTRQESESTNLTAKFDLTLFLHETPSGLTGAIEYATDLFDRTTIERLIARFERLLEAAAGDPNVRILDIPLLTEAERLRLTVEWNAMATRCPHDRCLHDLFAEQAAHRADAVAVQFNDQQLSYRELDRRANRLAHYLRARGIGPDTVVGICLERSLDTVVGLLGILKAGGAYLPLDPTYPVERLTTMMADAQAKLVVTQAALAGQLPADQCTQVHLDGDWPQIEREPATAPDSAADPDHLAYVIYTSGSTGRPKGVAVTHCNVPRLVRRANYIEIGADDVLLHIAPLAFDASTFEIWGALLNGARLVIYPDRFVDLERLHRMIADAGVSILWLTAGLFHQLVDDDMSVLAPLRYLLTGGEVLSARHVRRALPHLGSCRLINAYGPTEATTFSTCHPVRAQDADGRIPIGRPISNTQVFVLDPQLEPAPVGIPGELYVGGAGLARGYLGRPALTAERFVPNPFAAGERLYRTGDLVRWRPDSTLDFLGRLDTQVKIRGFRIEPGEIETALLANSGIDQAAVVVRHDAGDRRLVAYVVGEAAVDATGLRRHLQRSLPDYMMPAAFVALDRLPLKPSGKLDDRAFPAPDRQTERAHVAPRTPAEELLAAIWREVLKRDRVGIDDNFFELGGDSIQSIQVVARANRAGLKLTARQIFEQQTIARLATVVAAAASPMAEQGLVQGEAPLTPIQHWFFAQDLALHHFNQAVLLDCREPLRPELLAGALRQMVAQHDALRLRFRRAEDGWHQTHAAWDDQVAFEQVDLSEMDAEARIPALTRHADRMQQSLDLAAGPLLRAALFDLGARGQRLLLIIHHLVIDGVSWRILLEDLGTVYAALADGTPARLPAKTASFKSWAEQLMAYAGSVALQREAAYWTAIPWQQAGPLPVDHTDGVNVMGSARTVTACLDADDTLALLQDVPAVYHTQINDVLLTALVEAFAEWTGHRTLLVALEGHGREDLFEGVDLSRTVGWFTSLFPVLLDVSAAPDPGSALKSVKEQLRAVPHRGIGYGVLRWLGRHDSLPTPEPEVSFNYLGRVDGEGEQLPFRLAAEDLGALQGAANRRPHLIDISASVVDGRLLVQWFHAAPHDPATIAALAERYVTSLRNLIAHCRESDGGFTPSDVPLVTTRQDELDRLIEAVGGAREVEDIYPLSGLQQGLLFHSLYAPQSAVYVVSVTCRLGGPLDVAAFHRAWQHVVERHAVLRTAFVGHELDRPVQVVRRRVTLPFELHDWRGVPPAEQDQRFAALLAEDRARGFDFAAPPLTRLHLMRLAEAEWRLIWNSHHILFDGWSLPVLLDEVLAGYAAFSRGEAPRLAPVRPFRDYIGWLQRQDMAAAQTWWRDRLAGFTAPTALGIDRSAAAAGVHYAEHDAVVPVELAELESFARRHKLTVNTLVQGAWALLLARYADSDDVVFGVTVAGRPAELPEVERTVGLFINTLPLRLEVPPGQTVADWLHAVQARQTELIEHQYSPLSDVQRCSELPPGTALFDSIVAFENYPAEMAAAADIARTIRITEVRPVERTNYPLTLQVALGAALSLRLIYDADRFAADAIARMAGHFTRLLGGLIADPARPLSTLSPLDATERRQLIAPPADRTAWRQDRCLHELFAAWAARTPDAVALTCANETLSYGELESRANRLAHHLRALGVGPDVVVGLCVERSFDMVVGLLAILKAGGAYLPLDPGLPPDRLAYMLADARAPVLITQDALADLLAESEAVRIRLDADAPAIARQPATAPDSGADPLNLAYVIYTSGSTGRPKGTLVTHDCVTRLFAATDSWFAFGPHDVWTLFHSFAFDFSVWELFGALLHGGRLVIVPYWVSRSPEQFHALLAREAVTVLNQTPSAFAQMVRADAAASRELALRLVIFGGEALNLAELAPWFERHGDTRPQLVNMYGITETTVHVTFRPVRMADLATGTSPIGTPIPDLQLHVLDRHREPLPLGVAGEMHIGGAGLARGYLGRPALTAERFVPNPFAIGERLYRTGDLARRTADGDLDYLGRIDHQVKIRGFRIEPGEIEAALLAHPAVDQAAVVVRQDTGDRRLVAYLVGRGKAAVDSSDLRRHLQQTLPDYMVPAAFVALECLPLTTNGKLDRKALPAPEAHPGQTYVAPRNPAEQALAGILAGVLGLDRVGIDDNFFELGGDSIQSIQVVARANRAGLKLTARQIFEQPSIARLATVVAAATSPTTEQGLVQGEAPLTPIQHWFFAQDLALPHHFNQAVLLECREPLRPELVAGALRQMVAHHDALRLRFRHVDDDGWHQAHAAWDDHVAFDHLDLSGLDAEACIPALTGHADRLQQSLDLAAGPVLRAALFDLGARGQRLLLIIHHLVVDGVSWRILLEDLGTVYAALADGTPARLPAKTASFKSWAEQLMAYARSAALRREAAYWTAIPWQQAGRLPIDHTDGVNLMGSARTVTVGLDADDTLALLQDVPAVYHTQINDVLLTALVEAFAGWIGHRTLLVALEGHGREDLFEGVDLSRTVGWFTSLFPVLLDVSAAPDPGSALKSVKEQLRAVPRRGVGYGILRWLGRNDSLPTPEPEVSFNYLGQLDGGSDAAFRFASEDCGSAASPDGRRPHLIDVSGSVSDGRLRLHWTYSSAVHDAATIEDVAATFVARLQDLIAHCRESDGGFTPSDFPLLQADLSV